MPDCSTRMVGTAQSTLGSSSVAVARTGTRGQATIRATARAVPRYVTRVWQIPRTAVRFVFRAAAILDAIQTARYQWSRYGDQWIWRNQGNLDRETDQTDDPTFHWKR